MTDEMNISSPLGDQYRSPAEHFSLAGTGSFGVFWALGYRDLIPVIPPGVPISERSVVAKLVDTPNDPRGKAPGVRGRDGKWHSYDWRRGEADEANLARWHAMGASVGLRCGDVLAIDVDTLDTARAAGIGQLVEKHFGRGATLPMRIGRAPKRMYLVRAADPAAPPPYMRVEFETPQERVEILSVGRQAVMAGMHPKTGQPYQWAPHVPAHADLPVVTEPQLVAFLADVSAAFGGSKVQRSADPNAAPVNQEALKAPIDLVRKVVQLLPNDSRTAPGRDKWIEVGYCIKGATQDDPDEGLALWQDWSARWTDGENDPALTTVEWFKMKPPFKVGIGALTGLAERTADRPEEVLALTVERWFDTIPQDSSAAAGLPEKKPARARLEATPFVLQDAATIPPRDWLYGQHYLRRYVSVTVAPGGLGKSSLTIVEALAMATGRPLLGVKPKKPCRVWVVNLEDDIEELRRRATAACLRHGVAPQEFDGRLFLNSGRDLPDFKLVHAERDGAKVDEALVADLIQALEERQIDVLILDPFVSAHAVSENDNSSVDRVIKTFASVAGRAGCAIMVVHHARKAAGRSGREHQTTITDARGGSAIVDGARIVRTLVRVDDGSDRSGLSGKPGTAVFRFGDAKANFSPASADAADWFQIVSEPLGNGSGVGPDALMSGDLVGVVERFEPNGLSATTGTVEQVVERLLARLAGQDWRTDLRAKEKWIGTPIARELGLDLQDKVDRTQIDRWVGQLVATGHIVRMNVRDGRRHQVSVFRPTRKATPPGEDIFG